MISGDDVVAMFAIGAACSVGASGLVVGAWSLVRRIRARSRRSTAGVVRHPAYRRWRARRRLPEWVVAGLTDSEWPSIEDRLLSGEVYDPAGERIAREHARNVAEPPEIDGDIRRDQP